MLSKTLHKLISPSYNHGVKKIYLIIVPLFLFSSAFASVNFPSLNSEDEYSVKYPDLRRAEIVFFISLPFSLLYGRQTITQFSRLSSSFGAYRKQTSMKGNTIQYRPDRPNFTKDLIYVAGTSIIWASVITANDYQKHRGSSGPVLDFRPGPAGELMLFWFPVDKRF